MSDTEHRVVDGHDFRRNRNFTSSGAMSVKKEQNSASLELNHTFHM
jgi:hypothetical protein